MTFSQVPPSQETLDKAGAFFQSQLEAILADPSKYPLTALPDVMAALSCLDDLSGEVNEDLPTDK
jgi:hypothetical protein